MDEESDVIPRETLEPFTSPDKKITDTDQRRYSALESEIGKEQLIGEIVSEIEDELLDSRVNSRTGKLYRRFAIPTSAVAYTNDLPQEIINQTWEFGASLDGAPEIGALKGSAALGVGMLAYGTWQDMWNKKKYKEFAKSFQDLDKYRVLKEYEVGDFNTVDDAEALLTSSEILSYDIRMQELSEELDNEELLSESNEAIKTYRNVLNKLEDIHTEGVDKKTAEGVAIYGLEFLKPFYPDEEARERAQEIQSSGVAQVVSFKETEENNGENPILHNDQVFRLEVLYNQRTVATFSGTCEEAYCKKGEPLLEELPRTTTRKEERFEELFEEGVENFKKVSEDIGFERKSDSYKVRMMEPGGIPLYLRDAAVSTGRTISGTISIAGKVGMGIAGMLDYREVDH